MMHTSMLMIVSMISILIFFPASYCIRTFALWEIQIVCQFQNYDRKHLQEIQNLVIFLWKQQALPIYIVSFHGRHSCNISSSIDVLTLLLSLNSFSSCLCQEMIPADNTPLVLGTSCDNVANSNALPDPQMVFSFIPSEFPSQQVILQYKSQRGNLFRLVLCQSLHKESIFLLELLF